MKDKWKKKLERDVWSWAEEREWKIHKHKKEKVR